MFVVIKTTPLGHKYWMKATDGIIVTFTWERLKDNATIFGPQKDAVEHRNLAMVREPKSKMLPAE